MLREECLREEWMMIGYFRAQAVLLGALGLSACNASMDSAGASSGAGSPTGANPSGPAANPSGSTGTDSSAVPSSPGAAPSASVGGGPSEVMSAAHLDPASVDPASVDPVSVDPVIVDPRGSEPDAAHDAVPSAPAEPLAADPGSAGDGDFSIDTFSIQPDLSDHGAPRGKRFEFTMDSTKSVIFDGSDPTLQPQKPRLLTRNVVAYVPAQYTDGTPAPVLVIQDGPGPGQQSGQFDAVSRALDNLTTSADPSRRLPPFVAVAVQNGGNDSKGSERGLEYDTLSDRYARFVELEVLPAVASNAELRAAYPAFSFTTNPEGKATMGCSSGGAAAFTMTWFRPDLFRRAITYSGTFVAQQADGQPESERYPLGAWEYHSSTNLIANTNPALPIRAFLNVNGMDNGYNAPEEGYHNWVLANQHMASVLKERGYHYRFVTAQGIGHCDARAWQSTLADTLVWAWAGYP
jgi:iron(III)-enterobactin esterase